MVTHLRGEISSFQLIRRTYLTTKIHTPLLLYIYIYIYIYCQTYLSGITNHGYELWLHLRYLLVTSSQPKNIQCMILEASCSNHHKCILSASGIYSGHDIHEPDSWNSQYWCIQMHGPNLPVNQSNYYPP